MLRFGNRAVVITRKTTMPDIVGGILYGKNMKDMMVELTDISIQGITLAYAWDFVGRTGSRYLRHEQPV